MLNLSYAKGGRSRGGSTWVLKEVQKLYDG